MEPVWQVLESTHRQMSVASLQDVLLATTLAFVCGQLLAWVYNLTHSGLSYSKSFVQSLIMITVVVSLVMVIIGNSIVTAFGLMGALAIIRFRNILKDTRDMAFIFFSLVIGMATGSQRYGVAILGTVILSLIAFYLHWTGFGTRQPFNGFLRFSLIGGISRDHPIHKVLKKYCRNFTLVSVHDMGLEQGGEYAYQVTIKDHTYNSEMLFELELIEGLNELNLVMQESLLEV